MKFARACPECKKLIEYATTNGVRAANARDSLCRKCARAKSQVDYSGKNNPMFGRRHTAQAKAKQRKAWAERTDFTPWTNTEHRESQKKRFSGAKNGRYGKSNYDIWLAKHGKKEADERLQKFKKKRSDAAKGSGNPMYGKPSPQGSGNGWSGWFKGHYFRSLGELGYLLLLAETKAAWVGGELIRIPYTDWKGAARTYSPDFITSTEVIECKPQRLHETTDVLAKAAAGQIWAKGQGLVYRLVDPGKPALAKTISLVKSGAVRWMPRYEAKFAEYVAAHS